MVPQLHLLLDIYTFLRVYDFIWFHSSADVMKEGIYHICLDVISYALERCNDKSCEAMIMRSRSFSV